MKNFDLGVMPDSPTWVFTGDSITQGVFHTHGARSWVELVQERIHWELERTQDIVVNSGVSGWTAGQVLESFDHLVGRFKAEIVSISLGTNDSNRGSAGLEEFRTNLTRLVDHAAVEGAEIILHTPVLTMLDAGEARRLHLHEYAGVVREVAIKGNLILVDHEEYWKDHFGTSQPTPWMDDHTHPNAVGHKEMANTTLRVLGLGELERHR